MNRIEPIYSEKNECQDCYKCVRHCPVKAIRIQDGSAVVIPEACIMCGRCVQVCPAGAKRVRDDTEKARALIAAGRTVILSLAPSFASHYVDVETPRLLGAIRALGFTEVSETALGAEKLSQAVAVQLAAMDHGVLISTACPSAVDYMRMRHPELCPSLTNLHSPLCVHAGLLRKIYGPEIAVVFAGPCIAKKREADLFPERVNVSLTFAELDRWFELEGIDPASADPCDQGFSPVTARGGRLYPIEGGMCATVARYCDQPRFRTLSVSGMESVGLTLEGLDPESLQPPMFLELLACPGGCINGPRSHNPGTLLARQQVMDISDHQDRQPALEVTGPMDRAIAPQRRLETVYSEDEMRMALARVGKTRDCDELNCGGCGYFTCRDFATALLAGKAEESMCVSYMRRLAQKTANALIRTIPFGVVMVDAGFKVVDANERFVHLMGPEVERIDECVPGLKGAYIDKLLPLGDGFEKVFATGQDCPSRTLHVQDRILRVTLFLVEPACVAGALIEDVTVVEQRREDVVRKARQVIQNSLATVQDIAKRLGRNAADSEVILNSIVKCYTREDAEAAPTTEEAQPRGDRRS